MSKSVQRRIKLQTEESQGELGPESVVGVYCYTYPDHEKKAKCTCDHCVEIRVRYLAPEFQTALKDGERYRRAIVFLAPYVKCECIGTDEPGETHGTECPKRFLQDVLRPASVDEGKEKTN